ncbi:MAG TPA: hypothetical protein VG167_21245 [Verrucomicrobiae bacterium]|nr:hypothetical protein [Verrucomicrobiae bacterium]
MKGEDTNHPQQPPPLTLNPIRELGPACLDHKADPTIKDISLHHLRIRFEDSPLEEISIQADNLLDPQQPPIPRLGKPISATFNIHFHEDNDLHSVTITPPNVFFQHPPDAPRIFPWMDRTGFRIITKAANSLATILLALGIATAPAFADGDGDEDDPDSDRKIHLSSPALACLTPWRIVHA